MAINVSKFRAISLGRYIPQGTEQINNIVFGYKFRKLITAD